MRIGNSPYDIDYSDEEYTEKEAKIIKLKTDRKQTKFNTEG